MRESEVKKRIREKQTIEQYNMEMITVDEVLEILNEMWSEFPYYVLCNVGQPMFKPDENALNRWLQKWRGEKTGDE